MAIHISLAVPNKFKGTEAMSAAQRDATGKKKSADPLAWWKMHQGKFPTLEVLAKKFLAIQASSAPSERVFSQASLLISAKRTRLSPRIAGNTVTVRHRAWSHGIEMEKDWSGSSNSACGLEGRMSYTINTNKRSTRG